MRRVVGFRCELIPERQDSATPRPASSRSSERFCCSGGSHRSTGYQRAPKSFRVALYAARYASFVEISKPVPHCKPAFRHILHIFENAYLGRILVGEGEKIRMALHAGPKEAHRNLEMCNETPSPGLPAETPQCRWIHHYFCVSSSSEWCTTLPSVIPTGILRQGPQGPSTVPDMSDGRPERLAIATPWVLCILKHVYGRPSQQLRDPNEHFSGTMQDTPINPLTGLSDPLTPPLSMPVAQVPYFTAPSPITAMPVAQISDPSANPNVGWRNAN